MEISGKGIIFKVFISFAFFIIAGCGGNYSGEAQNMPDYILGTWDISYAKNGNTGEDYPLQNIYGTGIKYGGQLTFNRDFTFSRRIGVTTGETDGYEGTYSIDSLGVITLKFNNGTTNTAVYLTKSREIEYRTNGMEQIPVNEYYTRAIKVPETS